MNAHIWELDKCENRNDQLLKNMVNEMNLQIMNCVWERINGPTWFSENSEFTLDTICVDILVVSLHIVHPLENTPSQLQQLHCIPLNLHSWGSIGHFSRWSIVCVCSPQSHIVSASLYFHFSIFDLQRPIPFLSLFRYFQCNHGSSDNGPRSSDGMDFSFCGTDRMWWVHAFSRSAGGFVSSGVTECTKLFPDFRRLYIYIHSQQMLVLDILLWSSTLRSELGQVCLLVSAFPTQDTHISAVE